MRPGRITGVLGRVLLGLGALVLLFTAYQLWGTGVFESRSQAQLRQQFEAELHGTTPSSRPSPTTSTSITAPGGSSGIVPVTGATPVAPAEGDPLGIIEIPKIGVDSVFVEGTGTDDLRKGPGHYPATALPGQAGNVAIAGHRTTYGAPFYNLDALAPGDLIILTTTWGTFEYAVSTSEVVAPTDLGPLAPSTLPVLTLTTCNPRFSATQRLVVVADLRSKAAPGKVAPSKATTGTADAGLAGEQGDWVPALWWGLVVAALSVGVWLLAHGCLRRRHRWLVYGTGTVAVLVVLFFFFAAVSPLLPASY